MCAGLDGQDLLCDVGSLSPQSGGSEGGCDALPLSGLPPQPGRGREKVGAVWGAPGRRQEGYVAQ